MPATRMPANIVTPQASSKLLEHCLQQNPFAGADWRVFDRLDSSAFRGMTIADKFFGPAWVLTIWMYNGIWSKWRAAGKRKGASATTISAGG